MPLYRNSENNIQFLYKRLAKPRSEAELIALVKQCNQEGRRLKVTGGSHTFNHLKKTNDTLVDLSGIPEFTSLLSINRQENTVTLGGAMTLGDAVDALNEKGLHFSMLGSWFNQTISGAMATGTH